MALRTASSLIRLSDGILVEVEVPETKARGISGRFAESTSSSLEVLSPIVTKVLSPIAEGISRSMDIPISSAEVEFSLNFDSDGSIYITQSQNESNIRIKFVIDASKIHPYLG